MISTFGYFFTAQAWVCHSRQRGSRPRIVVVEQIDKLEPDAQAPSLRD